MNCFWSVHQHVAVQFWDENVKLKALSLHIKRRLCSLNCCCFRTDWLMAHDLEVGQILIKGMSSLLIVGSAVLRRSCTWDPRWRNPVQSCAVHLAAVWHKHPTQCPARYLWESWAAYLLTSNFNFILSCTLQAPFMVACKHSISSLLHVIYRQAE